ncbi:MAG: NifU N-terminal domain-containing protein [Acidimicrobiia bacterium]
MATATPSPTPNPEALRFALDATLPSGITATSEGEAAGHPFTAAVFATGKVAQIFGMNDFVTVTRKPGEDWDEIVTAVQEAAAAHL